MKKLLSFICNILPILVLGQTTYYVSSTGSDLNNGTSPSTPWQTVSRVNTFLTSAPSGSIVLFKRGDVFTTTTAIRMSNKSNITLGAYGSGSLPVITGFTTLTGWQSSGNGVQSVVVSSMNKPTTYPVPGNKAITPLNLLSINSIPQVLGRTPNLTDTNGGYRYYNHVAGTVNGVDTTKLDGTIAAGSLTGLKEVVFRTSEWNLYRGRIVSQVGGLLTFDLFYYIGNGVSPRIDAVNMAKSPWGYFYQNDSSYLDQFGEWHYDYPTKRLRVFFGANNPASYTVQVPLADTLISITSGTGLVIRDLRLLVG